LSEPIHIGICFTEARYANYPAWLTENNPDVTIIPFSSDKDNKKDLDNCHGLVLSGGIDIDPFFYQPSLSKYPNCPEEWNRKRDLFEMALFREALHKRLPVLGICRGLQLVNVALGGTLIPDIEASGKENHRAMNGIDHYHPVHILQNTLLSEITTVANGTVNSAHHQSINKVADTLIVNAYANEGIVEGVEWKEKENRSPLLCVQWHPERINDKTTNPLSENIKHWFLNQASNYRI
jgi:putative glutamine amidotransferase